MITNLYMQFSEKNGKCFDFKISSSLNQNIDLRMLNSNEKYYLVPKFGCSTDSDNSHNQRLVNEFYNYDFIIVSTEELLELYPFFSKFNLNKIFSNKVNTFIPKVGLYQNINNLYALGDEDFENTFYVYKMVSNEILNYNINKVKDKYLLKDLLNFD